jgi:hypothetical protein
MISALVGDAVCCLVSNLGLPTGAPPGTRSQPLCCSLFSSLRLLSFRHRLRNDRVRDSDGPGASSFPPAQAPHPIGRAGCTPRCFLALRRSSRNHSRALARRSAQSATEPRAATCLRQRASRCTVRSPREVTPPGLPQIPSCGTTAMGSSDCGFTARPTGAEPDGFRREA